MNEHFIDGSWYEQQYSALGSTYHSIYVANPLDAWAVDVNQYGADLTAAYLGLLPGAKVLDLDAARRKQLYFAALAERIELEICQDRMAGKTAEEVGKRLGKRRLEERG